MTIDGNDDDLEQSYFHTIRRGGDRTMGFLLAFIVLFFLFSLFFIGMYRTQSMSDQIAGEHNRLSVNEEVPEIGEISAAHK